MRKLLVSSLTALFLLLTGCNQGSKPISVAIVSPTGAQALDIGQSFNITVQVNNDKLTKGATFSMSGVGALSGQTATGATYTAPASGAGGNATITITSASDPTKTITLNVVVTAPPSISNASSTLTAGIQGVAYNTSVTETGGAGTLTYSVTLGSLPAGLTLNSSTGAITGSPTGTGTSTFTVQVKDSSTSAPQTSSKSFTITVNQQPTITSANTTTFVAGTPGTFSVTVTAIPNGAITITETGSLPTGITFVDNGNGTATLAGTTSTTGSFPITISAANGIGTAASQNFTLVVGKAPAISSANASNFTVGSAGTFAVTTTGFPSPALSESGALPSGVTFTDNKNGTATLAGTPAANSGGKYTFTITASNGIGANATQSFTLNVNQAPAVTSGNSTTFTINTLGTFTVTTNTSSYPAPALSESGALPTGVTFVDNGNGKATLAGTPTVSGSFPITITANNGVSPNATQNFTLTVGQAAAITSSAATTFTVGSAGTFNVTTTGFPAPTLSESGALPSGVTFHDNGNGTATLAGTPAANTGGKYTFTITAHNGIGADGTQSFTLTVNQAPAITSAGATTFSVSAAGSFTVTTSGFPVPALSESGALPAGVTFTDKGNGTATISGIPSAPGSFPITITASNGVSPNGTQTFTLTVNTAPAVTSANNTTFTVGATGTFTVTATGTPTPSLSESGNLPSGVTFVDNHNGTATLGGTPAANTGGTYNITITATNSVGSNNQTFTLTVDQAPVITSASNATFAVGSLGTFSVTTSGVPKAALSEVGALPSGVTFVDNGNGTATLSGTPASGNAGTYSITITANNGVSPNGTQTFTLTVNTAPGFTSGTSTNFTAGTLGTFSVTASGTPTPSFTESGALPSGVTFHDNGNGTATLSGTPAASTGGTYTFTISAKNSISTTNQSFTLTVDQAPGFTSTSSTSFTIGSSSSFTIMTSGFPKPALTEVGALPTGVSFTDNGNGTASLAGTPASGTAGSYTLTITATNGIGSNATQTFTLTVNTLPVFSSGNSTTFTVGTAGTFTVTASGSPSFTETGTLPSGVTFTDNGGGTATLAGTPGANSGGVYNFTIKATNGTGTTSQGFTLTVDQAPSIVSSSTATFAVGQLSTFNVGASGYPSPNITESGTLPSGVTFNTGTGALSGTPATGTAGSYPITFTASNGIGSNATQSFTLVVILDPCTGAGTGGESLLNGQYAFVLKGFDNGTGATETQPEPALVGGVLTFNGSGSITAGTLDQNLYNTAGVLSQAVTSGTYKVGSDHRACMDVTTTAGTTHYRASLANISSGVASLGHMIDFDPSGPFVSGIMKKQTTSAFGTGSSQVSGNYAFAVSSIDNTNQCNNAGAYCKFAAIGVFDLSAGSVTGGEVDFNENGQLDNTTAWPASPVSIASGGTYSVSSTTGRGTLVFKPSSPSNVTTIIYVVSSTDLLVLTSDDQTQNSLFAGELLQQSGTPFSANPLSGTLIGYQSGLSKSVTGDSRETLLLLNPSGSGISGTQYRNDAGSFQDKPLTGITYSVAPSSGRMTVLGGTNPPIFYLVNSSEAFSLGGDNATETGVFQSQTGGPFSGTTVSGSYAFGTIEPEVSGSNISAGIAIFANPNINVTEDDNSNGSLTVGGTQSFTYTVDATGLISIPSSGSSCTISASSTTCQTLLFIISPTKAVIMDTQSSNPKTQLGDK